MREHVRVGAQRESRVWAAVHLRDSAHAHPARSASEDQAWSIEWSPLTRARIIDKTLDARSVYFRHSAPTYRRLL